jgi:two-component sensor histidine kinase
VTELVMNAAKHAFPNRFRGRIHVEVYAPDGMAWCCTVRDNGCGIRNAAGGGAGSRIVDALVQMLDGQIAVDSGTEGTTVTVRFPAPLSKQRTPPAEVTE